MPIYLELNLPFPVCFGVSAIWESFELTFCSENMKVGASDQHSGKGCGCAWVGSKCSGLIFSWFEARLGTPQHSSAGSVPQGRAEQLP